MLGPALWDCAASLWEPGTRISRNAQDSTGLSPLPPLPPVPQLLGKPLRDVVLEWYCAAGVLTCEKVSEGKQGSGTPKLCCMWKE
jgi:hypothetical protein